MRAHASQPKPQDQSVDLLERVVARMRRLSPKQRVESLVRAGIFDADGKLTERYRPLSADDDAS